ncbi:hypothetical protein [Aurantiacibacter gilvus]|uniref:Uncharacterized protein n=1 Tax=Aurantiacibacter gilvus TaxID=3139141 RepID=A0ABU9IDH3_9SPHN
MTTAVMPLTFLRATGLVRAAMALPLLALAQPVTAQDDVTDNSPDAREVAMTPLTDLNLARDPIPEILIWARDNTYDSEGMDSCENIREGIGDLDAVLGDDLDAGSEEEERLNPGSVAQSVIGMFIPFRGIIREVSGANSHEYEFRQAIAAGLMRRSYLKGLGEARGCDYPARPMPESLRQQLQVQAAEVETAE